MFDLNASVVTNVGKVRTNNEDFATLIRPNHESTSASRGTLALVADGMGGHEGGELASSLAVEAIVRSYYGSMLPPRESLAKALCDANQEVFKASRQNSGLKGMGTTCIAVVICDDQAWWSWIGDSRFYLLRDKQIYRMSEDHTVVQQLIRRGVLTVEEAYTHPDRSVLDRAIGTRNRVEPEAGEEAIHLVAGDRLLLCSDGLHDLVNDSEMAEVAAEGSVADCAEALVQLALERGGYDNVSLILLEASPEATAPKRAPVITREHVAQ
jgi:serine/threonine protein phosphatase PrpC